MIRHQIKLCAIAPEMPCQKRLLQQGDVILQPGAGIGKKRLEHGLHRQHGGACIYWPSGGVYCAHFAARSAMPLQHSHLRACVRETQGRGQPADAGADDSDMGRLFRDGRLQGKD